MRSIRLVVVNVVSLDVYRAPRSPRFLLSKGKVDKARRTQRRIMRPKTDKEADAELNEIIRSMDTEKASGLNEEQIVQHVHRRDLISTFSPSHAPDCAAHA